MSECRECGGRIEVGACVRCGETVSPPATADAALDEVARLRERYEALKRDNAITRRELVAAKDNEQKYFKDSCHLAALLAAAEAAIVQLDRGHWVDDNQHDVQKNRAMCDLRAAAKAAKGATR